MYCTAMLWLTLIDVKSKQGLEGVERAEQTLLNIVFNILQLFVHLKSTVSIINKMGGSKLTFKSPKMPAAKAGGNGGHN